MSDREPDRMLTVSEVAGLLGVSRRTIIRRIQTGRIADVVDVGPGGSDPRYRIPARSLASLRRSVPAGPHSDNQDI